MLRQKNVMYISISWHITSHFHTSTFSILLSFSLGFRIYFSRVIQRMGKCQSILRNRVLILNIFASFTYLSRLVSQRRDFQLICEITFVCLMRLCVSKRWQRKMRQSSTKCYCSSCNQVLWSPQMVRKKTPGGSSNSIWRCLTSSQKSLSSNHSPSSPIESFSSPIRGLSLPVRSVSAALTCTDASSHSNFSFFLEIRIFYCWLHQAITYLRGEM